MDLLIIVLSFFLAYGVFILIALKLAKLFFPAINEEDNLKPQVERRRG